MKDLEVEQTTFLREAFEGHPAICSAAALFEARQRREWDDPATLDFGSPFSVDGVIEIYESQPRRRRLLRVGIMTGR